MSEDSRWDIDNIKYDWWFNQCDSIDFVVELVHEIERLQTEVIRLDDELDFTIFADVMYRDGMAELNGDE